MWNLKKRWNVCGCIRARRHPYTTNNMAWLQHGWAEPVEVGGACSHGDWLIDRLITPKTAAWGAAWAPSSGWSLWSLLPETSRPPRCTPETRQQPAFLTVQLKVSLIIFDMQNLWIINMIQTSWKAVLYNRLACLLIHRLFYLASKHFCTFSSCLFAVKSLLILKYW